MKPQEVQERLKLDQLKDKIWYVVPSCATTGEGLFEGLVTATTSLPFPIVADHGTRVGCQTMSKRSLNDKPNKATSTPPNLRVYSTIIMYNTLCSLAEGTQPLLPVRSSHQDTPFSTICPFCYGEPYYISKSYNGFTWLYLLIAWLCF